MKIGFEDILYILLPSVIGYGSTMFCKTGKDSGNVVKFRPPAYVFGIVWPILFILFGISWAIAMRNCTNKVLCLISYSLAVLSLAVWIFTYSCFNSKKGGAWILILTVAFSLMCFAQGNDVSRVLLAPLIGWAIFAMMMNVVEVQEL